MEWTRGRLWVSAHSSKKQEQGHLRLKTSVTSALSIQIHDRTSHTQGGGVWCAGVTHSTQVIEFTSGFDVLGDSMPCLTHCESDYSGMRWSISFSWQDIITSTHVNS